MFSHYVDMQFDEMPHASINYVFSALHGFMTKGDGKRFAIDLPYCSRNTTGDTLRVFADERTLTELINEPRFSSILSTTDCFETVVKEVPRNHGFVCIRRDRNKEREVKESYAQNPHNGAYLVYRNGKSGKKFSMYVAREVAHQNNPQSIYSSFGLCKRVDAFTKESVVPSF